MHATVLAGRYRIDEPVGTGGMGSVWRATDLELRRVVAVKRATNGDGETIRREARAGASLQHPNVIAVFDSLLEDGERWLVMEYLPSRSLAQVVREDGRLPAEQAAHVGAQVADALRAMHARKLVHRDITPGNVLIGHDGTVKLTDLGIAMWADATVTGEHHLAGTPGYTAPEVVAGHLATPAADVYSLGATLMDAVEPDGPLASVLAALTDPRAARRPTAEQARQSLLDRVPPRRNRRGLLFAAGAVAVAAAVTAAVVLWPSVPSGRRIIGDARTADPCPLLSESAFARFGESSPHPDEGDFNQCRRDVTVPGKGVAQVVLLLMDGPEGGSGDYPPPAAPGRTEVDRPAHEYGHCARIIRLPERYRVEVVAGYPDVPAIDACDLAEAPVSGIQDRLEWSQMPRRGAFPAGSLAHTDACALLTDLPSPFDKATPLPGFANWECTWPLRTDQVRALVLLHRRDPITPHPWDAVPIDFDGSAAFVMPDEWVEDKCVVEIPFRQFTAANGSEKVESAAVVVRSDQTSEQRCAVATELAAKAAKALRQR